MWIFGYSGFSVPQKFYVVNRAVYFGFFIEGTPLYPDFPSNVRFYNARNCQNINTLSRNIPLSRRSRWKTPYLADFFHCCSTNWQSLLYEIFVEDFKTFILPLFQLYL